MNEHDELMDDQEGLPETELPSEGQVEEEAIQAAEEVVALEVEPESVPESEVPLEEASVEAEPQVEEPFGEEEAVAEPEPTERVARIDLNTATVDELRRLPGIGAALAARIVNYREEIQPFEEPVEIAAVRGISKTMYDRIADRLIVSPVAEAEEVLEPEAEPAEEPAAVEVEEIPTPELEPPPLRIVTEPADNGWGRLLLVGLMGAVVGAVLALLALFIINNGTLNFRAAAARDLRREAFQLSGEIDTVRGELSQMEERVEAMQDLSIQLDEAQTDIRQLTDSLMAAQTEIDSMAEALDVLQTEFPNLREDLDALAENVSRQGRQLDEMVSQLDDLGEDLEAVQEAAQRFDAFLGGLRHLLNESMGPPTPTPWETPTSRPQVTVIPLKTPTPTPTP
ncbi:MAG: helix-hairpin-helix domain-containing protein [Anaerolineae bacterium]|jgi:competence protein ComEA